jgi:hypothetical protein
MWASTAFYGTSFTLLYVDDVRTSQATRPVTGTVFFLQMMFILNRKDIYGPRWSLTGIALLFIHFKRLNLYSRMIFCLPTLRRLGSPRAVITGVNRLRY